MATLDSEYVKHMPSNMELGKPMIEFLKDGVICRGEVEFSRYVKNTFPRGRKWRKVRGR
jgi:hypothetical protein